MGSAVALYTATMPDAPESPAPLDAATREREYSPSSAIGGNYAPFLAEYVSRSAAAPLVKLSRNRRRAS